jgi:hypothetical protein
MCNVTLNRVRETAVAVEKQYYECVYVALSIQQVRCMRTFVLSYVVCLALPFVPTLSRKRHDFRKKKILIIKRVF